MGLLMLKDALDRWMDIRRFELRLPYVPYARQDRDSLPGEAIAIRVFANLINSMGFSRVYITDPHSDVTQSLINNVKVTPQFSKFMVGNCFDSNYDAVVSPDAGALKKIGLVSKVTGLPVVEGFKKRDPSTGELSGFGYNGDVRGKKVLIVDDICDGGGTFVGLAKELLEGGTKSVSLFVTHGIFSKGLEVFDGVLDTVYTTNTIKHENFIDLCEGYSGRFKLL